jgi:hypothetical protein
VSDRTGRIIPKPPWERRDWKERSVLKGSKKSDLFYSFCVIQNVIIEQNSTIINWTIPFLSADGPQDTVAASATRSTYLPSLLHFHEEIMLLHNIKPSVPKSKPSLRDLIIKELQEKHPQTELKEYTPEPGLFMKIYLGLQGLGSKLPFFRKKGNRNK